MKLVKIFSISVVAFATITLLPASVSAHSYDTDDDGHPFRYLAYPLHAIGKGLEYGLTRPIHYQVSKPKCRYIFGHVSHPKTDDYWGDYDLYQRYSY